MAKAFNPISPEWKFTRAPLSFTSPFPPAPPSALLTRKRGPKRMNRRRLKAFQTRHRLLPCETGSSLLTSRIDFHSLLRLPTRPLFRPLPCRKFSRNGRDAQIWAKFARFRRNKFSQQNSTRISLLFIIEEQTNREIYLFRGEMMIPPFGYRFINKKFTTTNLIEKLLSRFFLSK